MASPHDDAWILKPQIPAIYVQTVLDIARSRGLDLTGLMAEAGLTGADLGDPSASISALAHIHVITQLITRTGNHGLGFEVGLSLPLTTHGNFGYALLCSASLRQACEVAARFWRLRERGARMQMFDQGEWRVIELAIDLAIPDELKLALFESLLAAFFRGTQLLLGDNHHHGELALMGTQPPYFERFSARLPPTRYDMPAYQFRFPLALLDRPLPMSNAAAFQHALAQCEREYTLLDDDGNSFLARVHATLPLQDGGYLSQERLADMLNMSLRTLRRKLQAAGTGYKSLLESMRRRDAMQLLETTTLNVQQIAERLGYLNPTNFTRAFKQWTGMTPREYRGRRPAQAIQYQT